MYYDLTYFKVKLKEIDYNQRLNLIYEWVSNGTINQKCFIELVNFAVNLDLVPTED